jgi:anti-sigma factor RsiW
VSIPSACEAALRQIDQYLDGEAATTVAHLEECAACQAELETRRRIRSGLRGALRQASPADVAMESRVRAAIRVEQAGRFRWQPQFLAAAAAVLITIGVSGAYHLGHLRFTTEQQDAYISTISSNVVSILRAGLQDHVHCSVFRKWPKQTPAVAELVREMEPQYRPVAQAVERSMPAGYQIIQAHQCGYNGRRFIHVAMRSDEGKLVSLVLARKQAGETFEANALRPVLTRPNFALYGASVQRFQIAGFETGEFLAYVVSDMKEGANRQLALSLAQPVGEALPRSM